MTTTPHPAAAVTLQAWHRMIASGDLAGLPAAGDPMGQRLAQALPALRT